MVTRILLALALLSTNAAADPAKLAAARRAIEEVRYDAARELLVDALKGGDNGPKQLREIYRLSAATALVLGDSALAEQYYRLLLALEPDATLPPDTSPKLREPFVAAQAYMAAQARFEITATRQGDSIQIESVDPLRMTETIAVFVDGKRVSRVPASRRTSAAVPLTPAAAEVRALDAHGNTLASIELAAATAPAGGEEPRDDAPALPIYRRWITWAIPAGVAAGVGIGFAIDAQRAKSDHEDIVGSSSMHFFDEAEAARSRWQRSSQISTVGFIAAGAFAATSIVMAVTRPSAQTTVTPAAGPDQVGVTVTRTF